MYRVGILLKNGERIPAENFDTKDKCETFILEKAEKHDIQKTIIMNKDNMQERWVEEF